MHPITNYIKERIKTLKRYGENLDTHDRFHLQASSRTLGAIAELQAVLSKIEELETIEKHRKAVKMFRQTSNQELNK